MKILIVIFVLMVIGNENINGACAAAVINQLFELTRTMLSTGNIEGDITILDPYEFHDKELYLAYGVLSVTANISNGILIGLNSCQLPKIDFSKTEISVELGLVCPLLILQAEHYELKGAIYNAVPILGKGKVDIKVHEFSLWTKVYLRKSKEGKSILIDRIEKTHFSIDRIVSRTEFDNTIDEIVNAIVEDLLASHLTRFSKYLAVTYSGSIIEKLNPILEKIDNTWSLLSPFL